METDFSLLWIAIVPISTAAIFFLIAKWEPGPAFVPGQAATYEFSLDDVEFIPGTTIMKWQREEVRVRCALRRGDFNERQKSVLLRLMRGEKVDEIEGDAIYLESVRFIERIRVPVYDQRFYEGGELIDDYEWFITPRGRDMISQIVQVEDRARRHWYLETYDESDPRFARRWPFKDGASDIAYLRKRNERRRGLGLA